MPQQAYTWIFSGNLVEDEELFNLNKFLTVKYFGGMNQCIYTNWHQTWIVIIEGMI